MAVEAASRILLLSDRLVAVGCINSNPESEKKGTTSSKGMNKRPRQKAIAAEMLPFFTHIPIGRLDAYSRSMKGVELCSLRYIKDLSRCNTFAHH